MAKQFTYKSIPHNKFIVVCIHFFLEKFGNTGWENKLVSLMRQSNVFFFLWFYCLLKANLKVR